MKKIDLTRLHKSYYTAKTTPEFINLSNILYISIAGKGDPDGEDFANNISALYPVAYALKFKFKSQNKDFIVPKLEGLWWFDDDKYTEISIHDAPKVIPRSKWNYRLLIRMPDFVIREDIEESIEIASNKKANKNIKNVEAFVLDEGLCIQMMHVGPFSTEPESLQIIHQFCEDHQLLKNGLHHEIYLSDFRKTVPEKLKTILREPVKKESINK